MKKYYLILICTFLFSITAQSQITLDASNFPQIGETIINVNATTSASLTVGNPGANQIYDFSMVEPIDSTTTTLVDPTTTPGSADFPNATYALGDTDSYFYLEETTDAIYQIGLYADFIGMGNPMAIHLNPTSKIFEIPTTYNTAYTDDWGFNVTIEDPSGTAGVDSVRTSSTTSREVIFDGYGSISTPDGTYECLREKIYDTNTTTLEGLTLFGWIEIQNETTMDTSYSWYAQEASGPLVSVGIFNGAITNVSYIALAPEPMIPEANFSAENMNNGVVQFTDLSNHSPTSWAWDFGDGNTSTEQHPEHTYTSGGTYTVCLTATNDLGSNTSCQTVIVDDVPLANFTFVVNGLTVDFTDASTNNPTSWLWDFGDGNTSTQQNPTHVYTNSDGYNVCLTATNAAGSNTICLFIFALIPPEAMFSYDLQTMGSIDFTDESTNDPDNWLWDFGDGNTSTNQNPQHAYSTPGVYTVCLTASNLAGPHTTCQDIEIVFAPIASFDVEDNGGGQLDFTDSSINSPTTWSWDFGDGNTSADQNPQHTFIMNDTYSVCLTISNSVGSDMTCTMIDVIAVGTDDLVKDIDILLSPNPVKDILRIELSSNVNKLLDMQIINNLGQVLLKDNMASNGTFEIDVNGLSSGIYFLVLLDENGRVWARESIVK
jgi:PKD repeat protein